MTTQQPPTPRHRSKELNGSNGVSSALLHLGNYVHFVLTRSRSINRDTRIPVKVPTESSLQESPHRGRRYHRPGSIPSPHQHRFPLRIRSITTLVCIRITTLLLSYEASHNINSHHSMYPRRLLRFSLSFSIDERRSLQLGCKPSPLTSRDPPPLVPQQCLSR